MVEYKEALIKRGVFLCCRIKTEKIIMEKKIIKYNLPERETEILLHRGLRLLPSGDGPAAGQKLCQGTRCPCDQCCLAAVERQEVLPRQDGRFLSPAVYRQRSGNDPGDDYDFQDLPCRRRPHYFLGGGKPCPDRIQPPLAGAGGAAVYGGVPPGQAASPEKGPQKTGKAEGQVARPC